MDPDPGGPKTRGSGFGSGSASLQQSMLTGIVWPSACWQVDKRYAPHRTHPLSYSAGGGLPWGGGGNNPRDPNPWPDIDSSYVPKHFKYQPGFPNKFSDWVRWINREGSYPAIHYLKQTEKSVVIKVYPINCMQLSSLMSYLLPKEVDCYSLDQFVYGTRLLHAHSSMFKFWPK